MEIKFNPSVSERVSMDTKPTKMMNADDIIYDDFRNIKQKINFYGYSEMIDFVKNNITSLLSSAVDKKPKSLQIITDKDFLIAMDIGDISIAREYINRFNRVYRSYMINPAKNVIYNQANANLLYTIAMKLNKKMIDIIIGLGLNESDALWLVINRYSSTDERRNIRRMVRVMQHIDARIMTEQMVVNIFAKTFNDQLTNLFCAVMADRFDDFDDENEKYVYSTVSNALLDILNTMDEEEIRDIILCYEDELRKSGTIGRFSLKSINSGDYGPICKAVESLEEMGIKIY